MRWLAGSLIVVVISGCSSSDSTTIRAAPESSTEVGVSAESTGPAIDGQAVAESETLADLAGRITLSGEIPPPRKLSINKDVEICGAVDSFSDVVGRDGGVADVVIEIQGIEPSADWDWQIPEAGFVIRQKDCQFTPNLLVVPNGQELTVFNDDPIGHNVNTGAWNLMQPPSEDPIVRPVEGKAPIKIACNIHVWMEGWIYPAQSPFYAVSDERGNYSITGIPPGRYRVTIWHPHLGRETERVAFDAGKVVRLDHEYESP